MSGSWASGVVILVALVAGSAHAGSGFLISNAISVCVELSLPNSMAKEKGFDADGHRKKLQSEFESYSREFKDDSAFADLSAFLQASTDELDVICGLKLAARSQHPMAMELIEKFRTSPLEGVPSFVDELIGADGIVLDAQGRLHAAHLSQFNAMMEPAVRGWPPQFKDEAHKQWVVASTKRAVAELLTLDLSASKDVAVLTDAGHLFSMAHNIDLPTGDDAMARFEQALALAPDDRRANYLFAMFLVSTRTHHMQSFPYFEKALALGEKRAQYTLGILHIERGEKEKGLELLEGYARDNPDDEKVREMIKAAKDGKLTFIQVDNSRAKP